MKRLRKFLSLPAVERGFLIKAAILLEAIEVGMRMLPFRALRYLLTRAADAPGRPRPANYPSARRIGEAVETANYHTPGAGTCLAQALATQVLLARCGYPALLHLGVARGEREDFQAHAWVESEGEIVIGGSEPGRYTTLAILEVEGRP